MKMNALMSQLLNRLDVSLDTDSLARSMLTLIEVDGSIVLAREFEQAKGVTTNDFPDRTGFEAFVNHVHLSFGGTRQSLRTCIQSAIGLHNELSRYPSRAFTVILSILDDNCVIRFHQLRADETWLSDDLEKYTEESILIL
jgi:hypothetical protein